MRLDVELQCADLMGSQRRSQFENPIAEALVFFERCRTRQFYPRSQSPVDRQMQRLDRVGGFVPDLLRAMHH